MITVSILINGQPIYTRSARNQDGEVNDKNETKYITDANDVIWHDIKNGAIELAKDMLDSIDLTNL